MPTKHQKKLFSQQEMDDINDAISKQAINFPSLSSGVTMKYTHNFTTSASPSGHVVTLSMEDLELSDMERVRDAIESMMDTLYPPFEPEIVHAPDKDYFLPALKVLVYMDGKYFSPQQQAEWKDMELEAECIQSPWHFGRPKMVGNDIVGFETPVPHSAPKEDCDCGIYGSVNLEEASSYLVDSMSTLRGRRIADYDSVSEPIVCKKLCIIEPSPGAKVIVCRKGWKASGAFISEIVNETISCAEASNLLSIAWNREIDITKIGRLHENR